MKNPLSREKVQSANDFFLYSTVGSQVGMLICIIFDIPRNLTEFFALFGCAVFIILIGCSRYIFLSNKRAEILERVVARNRKRRMLNSLGYK